MNLQNELHIKIHTTARFPAFVASGVGEPATFAMIGTIQMLWYFLSAVASAVNSRGNSGNAQKNFFLQESHSYRENSRKSFFVEKNTLRHKCELNIVLHFVSDIWILFLRDTGEKS